MPETYTLGADTPLSIPRIVLGLRSPAKHTAVQEQEVQEPHHAVGLDIAAYAAALKKHAAAGLDCFDVPAHYGPAEQVLRQAHYRRFTHWAPARDAGAEGCAAAIERMKGVDLVQLHVRRYEDGGYLNNLYNLSLLQKEGMFKHLGVANMDFLHLRMLKASGYTIATNQVAMSVLDRRAEAGPMSAWCKENGVALLATGTLLGGFVSEEWLGKAEPGEGAGEGSDKYLRLIRAAGGWQAFQAVLAALDAVAQKHSVPLAAVAMRVVLDIAAVAAVIVGTHLDDKKQNEHLAGNLAVFTLTLDQADRKAIAAAQEGLTPLPGDCGDEYRYPSHVLGEYLELDQEEREEQEALKATIAKGERVEKSSGSPWEPICPYKAILLLLVDGAALWLPLADKVFSFVVGPKSIRQTIGLKSEAPKVRIGNTFQVAGTTTRAHPSGEGVIGGSSVADQTTHVMDIITDAVHGVGASMGDITRTRVLLTDVSPWRSVGEVHAATMAHYGIRPVNTMVGGSTLIGDGILVEVEAMGTVRE